MNTTIQISKQHSHQTAAVSQSYSHAKTQVVATSQTWANAEFNRFGITPMLLIGIGIVGGFAAAVVIDESAVKLSLVAASTMMVEVFILALAPMRTITIATIIAFVVCIGVMVF